jgi:dimethylargininase
LTRPFILTRLPGDDLASGELTHLARVPIDMARAKAQHAGYRAALIATGAEVKVLPPLPGHPDAVFVEDAVIALPEIAILTRPGAASRQGEIDSIEAALPSGRPVSRIAAPGTLDGGDVLRVGKRIFVGHSTRTNAAGIAALAAIAAPFGYSVTGVAMGSALHLKTAITALAPDLLLLNPAWIDAAQFEGFKTLEVAEDEPFAANILPLGGRIHVSAAHPKTTERIRDAGFHTHALDMSELAKAEAGLTCMSVVFD